MALHGRRIPGKGPVKGMRPRIGAKPAARSTKPAPEPEPAAEPEPAPEATENLPAEDDDLALQELEKSDDDGKRQPVGRGPVPRRRGGRRNEEKKKEGASMAQRLGMLVLALVACGIYILATAPSAADRQYFDQVAEMTAKLEEGKLTRESFRQAIISLPASSLSDSRLKRLQQVLKEIYDAGDKPSPDGSTEKIESLFSEFNMLLTELNGKYKNQRLVDVWAKQLAH